MRHSEKISPAIAYIRETFAPEDVSLKAAAQAAQALSMPIHIGAEEGKLLQLLIRLHGGKRYIELGTLTGYSALWIARALPEGGELITIERNPQQYAEAQRIIGVSDVAHKVRLLQGDGLAVLEKLASEGPFDGIFIDADKLNYANYLDWAERNVRQGGLILGDNTLLWGGVYLDPAPEGVSRAAQQSMQAFNATLADSARYHSILIPTQEGLTAAIKLFKGD